jgi:8-oxo-dGTP pyrophosphatase MutT (NUDIX family)
MKTRAELLEALQALAPHDGREAAMRDRIARFVREHEECYSRDLLVGHVTGSAWIVDRARSRTLLTHHAKLNKWLQPGGHADGDSDILRVARREMLEETGQEGRVLLGGAIFDVDAHEIPERKGVPAHVHYDIRFAFEADPEAPLLVSEESHELCWIPLDEVARHNTDESVLRMVEKTKQGALPAE